MKTEIRLDKNLRLIGTNESGQETAFDTHKESGGDDSAPTPMEIILQALAACSSLDVLSILKKKKKTIKAYKVYQEAERSDSHPKVFTKVNLIFELHSPDAEIEELNRAIELSETKYCSVSAMFQRSGCIVTWEGNIQR